MKIYKRYQNGLPQIVEVSFAELIHYNEENEKVCKQPTFPEYEGMSEDELEYKDMNNYELLGAVDKYLIDILNTKDYQGCEYFFENYEDGTIQLVNLLWDT